MARLVSYIITRIMRATPATIGAEGLETVSRLENHGHDYEDDPDVYEACRHMWG